MPSSLKLYMSINFYQQVKFTRPLTLQDCGSPVLLTVSPTYWSDCEWEGDRLKMCLESENPRLYMAHIDHMFTSKNNFRRGFLAMKTVFWDHTCVKSCYDGWKINLETKMCGRKWNLSRFNCVPWLVFDQENGGVFFFFFLWSATFFLVDILGLRLHWQMKWIVKKVLFRFVCSVWHAIISTQKYILTRVSAHDKRVWWPYMVSIITEYDQVRNQKLREKLKHQGFSSIFQMHDLE